MTLTSTKMKVFVICPVRNVSPKEERTIRKYVERLENNGIEVHWPQRDTPQGDPIGINIVSLNRTKIEESDEVHVFWNPASQGSLFDLGMMFAFGKKVVLINKVDLTPAKSFNNVLRCLAGVP